MKGRIIVSTLLALLLLVSMPVSALAATWDIGKGDITVNAESGGQTVTQGGGAAVPDSAPVITGTSKENTLTINAESGQTASVTLSGVNIDVRDKGKAAVSTTGEGNVSIELNGGSTLRSGYEHAGLEKNNGGSLTIGDENKDGKLTAEGGKYGAGIGGGYYENGSDITITGGEVNAIGGVTGAGIGGGCYGDGNNITVSGDAKLKVQGGVKDKHYGAGAGIGNGGKYGNHGGPNGAEVEPDICELNPSGKIEYYAPGSDKTGTPSKTVANPTGDHVWNSGTVTKPATCTEKGVRTYTCTSSTHTRTEDIPALNHSFAGQAYVSDNNATCEQDGTKTIRCVRYGRGGCTEKDTVVDTGSMLGHSFDEEAYVFDNNATCEQDGTKTAKCVRYGTGGCTETNTVTDVGSRLGHLFEDYVSDNNATYGRDGTKTAKCVRYDQCGAINTILDVGSRLKKSKLVNPLYRVPDKDGKDIAYTAEQKDGVLTVTVDADFAVLTGKLSGIGTLKAQGVEKIVFVTKDATSAFRLADLLEKGAAGETYKLTHDGKTAAFTAGGQQTDISDILVKA